MTDAPTITGVAIKDSEGRVIALPAPRRHGGLFALAAFMGQDFADAEQGFMTSEGRFVAREEAYTIASEAGQLISRYQPGRMGPLLFSEDVW